MFSAAFLSRKSNLLDSSIKIGTQPSLSWFDQSLVISCLFLSVFVVAELAHLIISLSDSHLKQDVLDSGYLDFIAKMDDKVPPSFREERLSVLFFLTTLKSLSSSVLLCGNTKTISANLSRHLRRFADVLGIVRLLILRCHHKISI